MRGAGIPAEGSSRREAAAHGKAEERAQRGDLAAERRRVALRVQRGEKRAHLFGLDLARARLAAEERDELAQVGEIGAAGMRGEVALVAQVHDERLELARGSRAHETPADASAV